MTPTNAKPLPLVLRLVIAICFAALGLLQCPSTVSRPQNSPPSPLSSPHEERGGFRFVSCDGSSSYFTAAGCKFNRGELHEGQGRDDHAQPRYSIKSQGAQSLDSCLPEAFPSMIVEGPFTQDSHPLPSTGRICDIVNGPIRF